MKKTLTTVLKPLGLYQEPDPIIPAPAAASTPPPTMPIADEEEKKRQRRLATAQLMSRSGRQSTILSDAVAGTDTLG